MLVENHDGALDLVDVVGRVVQSWRSPDDLRDDLDVEELKERASE